MSDTVGIDRFVYRDGLYYSDYSVQGIGRQARVPFTGNVKCDKTGKYMGSFKDGLREGPWVTYWFTNGELHDEGDWKDGKRKVVWASYGDDAVLISAGAYKDGLLEGPHVAYDGQGWKDKINSGIYRNGRKVSRWPRRGRDARPWRAPRRWF